LVGGCGVARLLERERRRACAVSCIRHRVVLSVNCAGPYERSRIVRRRSSVDIAAAGGQIFKENKGSWRSTAGEGDPGNRWLPRVLVSGIAGMGALIRRWTRPPAAVGGAVLAVSVFEICYELSGKGQRREIRSVIGVAGGGTAAASANVNHRAFGEIRIPNRKAEIGRVPRHVPRLAGVFGILQ
jgi:hypothetical protein